MAALSRRSVLRGSSLMAMSGVAGFVVARQSDAAKPRSTTTAANAYGAVASQGQVLAALADIPVGGGLVLERRHIVVTRDDQDVVRGFSSTCTHQGCTVSSVSNGTIDCPCHGSRFDVRTGSPTQGPATRALPKVAVVVRDGNVYTS
jgi:Rieske Fe-S protein